MKTFFATLAALLIAMLVGYGVWKHERWVEAKNQCLNLMAVAEDAGSSDVDAARALITVFHSKVLPLSKNDRAELSKAEQLVRNSEFYDEWDELIRNISESKTRAELEHSADAAIEFALKHGELRDDLRSQINDAKNEWLRDAQWKSDEANRNSELERRAAELKASVLAEPTPQ